ncbi:MAG: AarF/ABC1/UbiB kinase family protein [Pseudomonadota bacterium]
MTGPERFDSPRPAGPRDADDGAAVPSGRLSRFLAVGGLAGRVAGAAVAGGIGDIARLRRPNPADLLLSPANARRIADELARMRGAAMKVGQLMSMDAGDVLPPEIASILARLRDDARPMPPKQLRDVLTAEWGAGWLKQFASFDVRPIASASIGQVHKAETRDGRKLAIKVQYPGVRDAVDSDVRNLAGLVRLSGMLPRGLDISPVIDEARRQLLDETEYLREAEELARFGAFLKDDPGFRVPAPADDFSTRSVLAMEFIESVPLDRLAEAPQDVRDDVAGRLIALVLRELFEFGAMQTDPNLANYRYERDTGRVVLLDFGAARTLPDPLVASFRQLMRAGLDSDWPAAEAAARDLAILHPDLPARHTEVLMGMFELAMASIREDRPFDFGSSDLMHRLRDMGLQIGSEREFWTIPATDTILVQRKVAGTYLMAARLKARVNLHRIVRDFT